MFKPGHDPSALCTGYQARHCACLSLSRVLREGQQLPWANTAFWYSAGVPAAGYCLEGHTCVTGSWWPWQGCYGRVAPLAHCKLCGP